MLGLTNGSPEHEGVLGEHLGLSSSVEAVAPAFRLIHGDADGLGGEHQSRRMHAALTEAGADSTLLMIAGANHEDAAFHSPAVIGAVAGFFTEKLRHGGATR
jgi:dipeptidyl aminopeptidase/acylaminoacyl peptidase